MLKGRERNKCAIRNGNLKIILKCLCILFNFNRNKYMNFMRYVRNTLHSALSKIHQFVGGLRPQPLEFLLCNNVKEEEEWRGQIYICVVRLCVMIERR